MPAIKVPQDSYDFDLFGRFAPIQTEQMYRRIGGDHFVGECLSASLSLCGQSALILTVVGCLFNFDTALAFLKLGGDVAAGARESVEDR